MGGKIRYDRTYERDKDFVQLNFHDMDGWSGHFFYNRNILETKGTDYYSATGSKKGYPKQTNSKERNLSYGYDFQKLWEGEVQTFLLGTSFERNEYYNYSDANRTRNIFSLFASWDKKLSEKIISFYRDGKHGLPVRRRIRIFTILAASSSISII